MSILSQRDMPDHIPSSYALEMLLAKAESSGEIEEQMTLLLLLSREQQMFRMIADWVVANEWENVERAGRFLGVVWERENIGEWLESLAYTNSYLTTKARLDMCEVLDAMARARVSPSLFVFVTGNASVKRASCLVVYLPDEERMVLALGEGRGNPAFSQLGVKGWSHKKPENNIPRCQNWAKSAEGHRVHSLSTCVLPPVVFPEWQEDEDTLAPEVETTLQWLRKWSFAHRPPDAETFSQLTAYLEDWPEAYQTDEWLDELAQLLEGWPVPSRVWRFGEERWFSSLARCADLRRGEDWSGLEDIAFQEHWKWLAMSKPPLQSESGSSFSAALGLLRRQVEGLSLEHVTAKSPLLPILKETGIVDALVAFQVNDVPSSVTCSLLGSCLYLEQLTLRRSVCHKGFDVLVTRLSNLPNLRTLIVKGQFSTRKDGFRSGVLASTGAQWKAFFDALPSGLQTLVLDDVSLSEGDASAFLSGFAGFLERSQLRSLTLCPIGSDEAETGILDALAGAAMPYLEELSFEGTMLLRCVPESIDALCLAPWRDQLRTLDLGFRTGLSLRQLEMLLSGEGLPKLERLSIRHSYIGNDGWERLGGAACMGSLRVLSLPSSQATGSGLKALLRNNPTSLVELSMEGNRLMESGAKALANWPGLANLLFLDVSRTRFGPKGHAVLQSCPQLFAEVLVAHGERAFHSRPRPYAD
jgi:hypothetical protein